MNELESVKAGDKVYIERGYYGFRVATVSKVTPTQIVIKGHYATGIEYEQRFRRKDGRAMKGDSWYRESIQPMTPELFEKVEFARLKKKAETLRDKILIPKTKDELLSFIAAIEPFTVATPHPASPVSAANKVGSQKEML